MRGTIGCPELIQVGDNFMLSVNAHITAYGSKGIFIGDNVGIGRGSYIHASNHIYENTDVPIRSQGIRSKDIKYNNTSKVINDRSFGSDIKSINSWVYGCSIILPRYTQDEKCHIWT